MKSARQPTLFEGGTWPQKWTGDEPTGDEPFEETYADGTAQPLLFEALGGGSV